MEYLPTIIFASIAGFLARLYMLRRDYRQYPSYPQGWAVHLFIGFIGALLGSVLVPSLLEKEFTAVSFLLMAASQFREVRNIERSTLEQMEQTELVARGTAYIEGIARVFEARNYLAIWTAFIVAISVQSFSSKGLAFQMGIALVTAVITGGVLNRLMRGPSVGDIATIEATKIEFDGPILIVEGVDLMNIGLGSTREIYKNRAVAARISPKDPDAKATLANIGQMQAIAHDVSSMVCIYMDVGEQEFTPLVRRDADSGKLVLVIIPSDDTIAAVLEAVANVPVLEGAVRKPLRSVAGRMLNGGK